MDEHVRPATLHLDEAKTFLHVEEFHRSCRHRLLPWVAATSSPITISADERALSSMLGAPGGGTRLIGVRRTPIEGKATVVRPSATTDTPPAPASRPGFSSR